MGIRRAVVVVSVVFPLFFALVLFRIVYIDFFAPYRQRLAYAKTEDVDFVRGAIRDRNGDLLADSIRQISVAVDPTRIPLSRLNEYIPFCNILGVDFREFRQIALRTNTRFVWIRRKVDDATAERVRRLGLPGVKFVTEFNRFYPNRTLACHVLGCVGVDNNGLEGIELLFDRELRGSLEDEDRQRPGVRSDRFNRTVEGREVVLTIDKRIQHAVERELERVWKEVRPESVSALVMDPATGEILAMANLPDFDPNNPQLYAAKSMKNLCVAAYYEPGSVFKIVTAAVLISRNAFPLGESYVCEGEIKVGGKTLRCWKRHGTLAVADILKHSCNVGMARLARRLSAEDLYNGIRAFGFGSLTGVELPGEVRGLLRLPHRWGEFSKAAIAIGQEVGVTPLQLITACAAVANGGQLMQPRIVREVRYPDGTVARRYEPLPIRRVLSSNQAALLTSLLVRVTEKGGTGELAALPRYAIAGKTGTAQVFDNAAGRYYKDRHILSFLGYYPAERPEVVILVVVRNPAARQDLTGGMVAAPVFRNIATAINGYRRIIPARNIVEVPSGPSGLPPVRTPAYTLDAMPDFTGYNMRQVAVILNNLGLRGNYIGSGVAYRQTPPPGSKILRDVPVTVWFREEPASPAAEQPR